MGTIPSDDIYDFFAELINQMGTRDKILDLLPDYEVVACSIISCVIDEYFIRHDIKPSEGWKELNRVASIVHAENNE